MLENLNITILKRKQMLQVRFAGLLVKRAQLGFNKFKRPCREKDWFCNTTSRDRNIVVQNGKPIIAEQGALVIVTS